MDSEQYLDSAKTKVRESKFDEAIIDLIASLSIQPSNVRARLVLAKVFYNKGFHVFAVRELIEILKIAPEDRFVKRLIEKIAPEINIEDLLSKKEEKTLAEATFTESTVSLIEEAKSDRIKLAAGTKIEDIKL